MGSAFCDRPVFTADEKIKHRVAEEQRSLMALRPAAAAALATATNARSVSAALLLCVDRTSSVISAASVVNTTTQKINHRDNGGNRVVRVRNSFSLMGPCSSLTK